MFMIEHTLIWVRPKKWYETNLSRGCSCHVMWLNII